MIKHEQLVADRGHPLHARFIKRPAPKPVAHLERARIEAYYLLVVTKPKCKEKPTRC